MEQGQLPGKKKLNFCLYARKSSERDELQALSIDSQIKEMQRIAEASELNVVDVRQESHSAKDSAERPVFNQMIKDIKSDKFQGILTWAPDRLSRNAGDLGSLVDLMDQNYLIEIRTCNQVFTNSPNDKFLLMILGSQAKLENDNKAINVKRGLKAKCEMGFRPGAPPLGYINEKYAQKGEKKIFLDPDRAPFIKQMFEKVAYEDWSGRDVHSWLRSVDFTTRTGKNVTLSSVYELLKQTYYYGEFEYPITSGNWYKVAHESIITKELFEEVQRKISVAPRTRPGIKEFEFTRLFKCGGCGSGVCAEEKFKKLIDGSTKRYVYYHCTKGADRYCRQGVIPEEDLLEQLVKLMNTIPINNLRAQTKLKEEMERYRKFTETILLQKDKNSVVPKVDLRSFAKYVLREGSRDEKREIINCIGTTIYLKDRKIYIK